MTAAQSPGMTAGRTLTFAIASGLAVGNLYWAQPLLDEIARTLDVATGSAGALVTVTQIGYAVGIFLIVPLGDMVDRRTLIPAMLLVSAGALLAAARAPSFTLLVAALGLVGLSTVSAQLLSPLASDLADPGQRGRVVGAVVSGALIGILVSRTVSGLVAGAFGWRAIYMAAAVAAVTLAVVLWFAIPKLHARAHIAYPQLIASVFTTVAQHPAALPTLVISASNFAVFSLFWTALTFLLSAAPFSYSVAQIGLVGLAGLVGALAARRAGTLHDRGWSVPATGAALLVLLLSLGGAALGATSIVALLVVIVVLDVAVQYTSVLSQTRLFALPGEARSRLNTAIVTSNFIGAAVGSPMAAALWSAGRWLAVMAGAAVVVTLALVVWAWARRGRLVDLS
jgi:predicted MFS family arabinose efflux permease